jgi:hypothetical protein
MSNTCFIDVVSKFTLFNPFGENDGLCNRRKAFEKHHTVCIALEVPNAGVD